MIKNHFRNKKEKLRNESNHLETLKCLMNICNFNWLLVTLHVSKGQIHNTSFSLYLTMAI
jgi:hypothetical protein